MTPTEFTAWREALGGRKFFTMMGANIINTLLFACSKLSESGYLTTFSATVGIYLLANYHEKKLEKGSE